MACRRGQNQERAVGVGIPGSSKADQRRPCQARKYAYTAVDFEGGKLELYVM